MKKLLSKILVPVMLIASFTIPISADVAYYEESTRYYNDYFDGKLFYVVARINADKRNTVSFTNYGGTNIQIFVRNTSRYGENATQDVTTNVGYDGGTISATSITAPRGAHFYLCTTYGNVKKTDNNMISRTIAIEHEY